jgi:nucleotide-binding universal stress UspA family protein
MSAQEARMRETDPPQASARRIVIGYDGSDEARNAVAIAARVLSAECALVVNVWPAPALAATTIPAAAPAPVPFPEHEAELERAARETAEEGAERARAAGLDAFTAVRRGGGPADVARVLHEVADGYAADLIVVGHRHASRIESALFGSVATSCVREERRPVLVVPA